MLLFIFSYEKFLIFVNIVSLFIFSGPNFWGLLNLEWSVCNKGKNQSPINIDPGTLLFDPHLENLKIDGNMVSKTNFISVIFLTQMLDPQYKMKRNTADLYVGFSRHKTEGY